MAGADLAAEFPGVTPQLVVEDTDAAVRFYRVAFGADDLLRHHGPDGHVMHCELLLNGGRLLLHDDYSPQHDSTPTALGGTPVTLHLYVSDVDATYAAALAAGATSLMAPQDAFWGDRYARIRDPFGHRWSLATPHDELTPVEMNERSDRWATDRRRDGRWPVTEQE